MRIRIEGDGHCVEIDCGDTNRTPEQNADLAETVWTRTKAPGQPRMQVGFGSQLTERTRDRPVAGSHYGEEKPEPVVA